MTSASPAPPLHFPHKTHNKKPTTTPQALEKELETIHFERYEIAFPSRTTLQKKQRPFPTLRSLCDE
ncbi:MAG TPA: hypothetical protein DCE42_02580 [Myxococcales bacterium]|nr:hypothetical protein [Deltaproteobacteria bacterium]HAA53611.1 hypothetical protein [Myxococcales bacterium]